MIVEDKRKWFRTFTALYEQALPLVEHISNVDMLNTGGMPVDPYILLESNLTLRPIMLAMKRMPEPGDTELARIRREFITALSGCLKAADMTAKYVAPGDIYRRDPHLIHDIINSTVLAHEYIQSVSKRVDTIRPKLNGYERMPGLVPASILEYLGESKITAESAVQTGRPLSLIDRVANYIEYGLDKLGDALTFPIKKTAIALTWLFKSRHH